MAAHLGYEVFIAEPIPQNVSELVPNGDRYMWSPQSTTLIFGDHDAVLVDPPFTTKQAGAVSDWVRASGKRLTHIFITHGHGDHWFTAGVLANQFGAQVAATPGTIKPDAPGRRDPRNCVGQTVSGPDPGNHGYRHAA